MKSKTRATVLKWSLLALLLTYAVSMTVWASGRADARLCSGVDIEVSGVRPEMATLFSNGIKAHLDRLVHVEGKPVGSLDLPQIQRWISSLSNVEDAMCAFRPDGRLLIRAEALVPEMRIFGPGGESYYVNREGKRMQARHEFFIDVPVVSGRFDKKFNELALIPLVRLIETDPELKALVSMIEVQSPDNILLIPAIEGHTVNLGDTAHLNRKLTALKAFYRKVMPHRGWQTYKALSVKYAGRVTATLRNKPTVATTELDTIPDVEEQALNTANIEAPANPAPLTNRGERP